MCVCPSRRFISKVILKTPLIMRVITNNIVRLGHLLLMMNKLTIFTAKLHELVRIPRRTAAENKHLHLQDIFFKYKAPDTLLEATNILFK